MLKSLFNKVGSLQGCIYLKDTPTQMFPCEYCETPKNTHSEEHPRTAAPREGEQPELKASPNA